MKAFVILLVLTAGLAVPATAAALVSAYSCSVDTSRDERSCVFACSEGTIRISVSARKGTVSGSAACGGATATCKANAKDEPNCTDDAQAETMGEGTCTIDEAGLWNDEGGASCSGARPGGGGDCDKDIRIGPVCADLPGSGGDPLPEPTVPPIPDCGSSEYVLELVPPLSYHAPDLGGLDGVKVQESCES